MKRLFLILFAASTLGMMENTLRFDQSKETTQSLTMPSGETVTYKAWEGIYFVTNIEDSVYQTLNFYFPDGADQNTPILLRTYVGGYMASTAKSPSADDATGRALLEGYAVCIPGSRGSNSTVKRGGGTIYTGRAPAALLDLKAAVRYLKFNDQLMPGDANRIISDGTSAGGAMSALLGATGNHPLYQPYLQAMGAAPATDDIFAAVCYCPITDLDYADAAYEWLYFNVRSEDDSHDTLSKLLASTYLSRINALNMRSIFTGEPVNPTNYRDYVKQFLINSLQHAQDEGTDLPDSIGIVRFEQRSMPFAAMTDGNRPPVDGRAAPMMGRGGLMQFAPRKSEFIIDLNLDTYLRYVASTQPLKQVPAFDALNILGGEASAENNVFGDDKGNPANFSLTVTHVNGTVIDQATQKRVRLYNPMCFIDDMQSSVAPNWYIRHGARDRDTAFTVSINLATKLSNSGRNVDFALPYNRPHSGDYNLNDLFRWIKSIAE
ncbi:MAG: alpha/beta hydrolase [Muribaculaceae bacterium]|nr:alpha/beta hydrolase [Muribaculaceae bacterium]